jgi:hypothetical protein
MINFKVKYHADVPKVKADNTQQLVKELVTKVLTLKDLDQYDESQNAIHFACEGLIGISADGNLKADPETVMYIAKIAINNMFVETPEFTKIDLIQFKKDGFGFARWGTEFITKHIVPFFLKSGQLGN